MKNLFVTLLLLLSFVSFAQNINNYEIISLPVRFDFQNKDNQYRISTMLKLYLTEIGFKVFYNNEYKELAFYKPCEILFVDLIEVKGFLKTKLKLQLLDCDKNVLHETPIAQSKEKDFQAAYKECMEQIAVYLKEMNYEFIGKDENARADSVKEIGTLKAESLTYGNDLLGVLYAQPTENGFQLVNTIPKVVMKLFKTSQPNFYAAKYQNFLGVVFQKENQWFFECSVNGTLKTLPLEIKF